MPAILVGDFPYKQKGVEKGIFIYKNDDTAKNSVTFSPWGSL